MAKNGDKLAFSFNLRNNPQRVAVTENILGIVHAYLDGKDFDGVSKYTRLDAERAFGFFQACDFLEDSHTEEYLLLMASYWDPDFIHACYILYNCLEIRKQAKYNTASQFLNAENYTKDMDKYDDSPNPYLEDFELYCVNDYVKDPNHEHYIEKFGCCWDEEEGILQMREWLKVIEQNAGHSLADLTIEYDHFTKTGPYPDMQNISWYKTSDPKIAFLAELNITEPFYRSRMPECWPVEGEEYSLHYVHSDSPSLNWSKNGEHYVRKIYPAYSSQTEHQR